MMSATPTNVVMASARSTLAAIALPHSDTNPPNHT